MYWTTDLSDFIYLRHYCCSPTFVFDVHVPSGCVQICCKPDVREFHSLYVHGIFHAVYSSMQEYYLPKEMQAVHEISDVVKNRMLRLYVI